MDIAPMLDWFGPIMILSLVVPLVITGAVVALVIWAVRRNAPPREHPAVVELKARYARGEISPVEFEVRLRSLTQDRD